MFVRMVYGRLSATLLKTKHDFHNVRIKFGVCCHPSVRWWPWTLVFYLEDSVTFVDWNTCLIWYCTCVCSVVHTERWCLCMCLMCVVGLPQWSTTMPQQTSRTSSCIWPTTASTRRAETMSGERWSRRLESCNNALSLFVWGNVMSD